MYDSTERIGNFDIFLTLCTTEFYKPLLCYTKKLQVYRAFIKERAGKRNGKKIELDPEGRKSGDD